MNPMALLSMKNAFETFKNNHPKFVSFVQAVARPEVMNEGTILECKITTPDGKEYQSNIKITQSDLELFQKLKELQ